MLWWLKTDFPGLFRNEVADRDKEDNEERQQDSQAFGRASLLRQISLVEVTVLSTLTITPCSQAKTARS